MSLIDQGIPQALLTLGVGSLGTRLGIPTNYTSGMLMTLHMLSLALLTLQCPALQHKTRVYIDTQNHTSLHTTIKSIDTASRQYRHSNSVANFNTPIFISGHHPI